LVRPRPGSSTGNVVSSANTLSADSTVPSTRAGLLFGDSLLQGLKSELQLLVGQLLGATAELVTRQALDQHPQLVILGVQLAQHLP
jgi:hypothetical protein